MRAGFLRHCNDDKWSAEAQQCFLDLRAKEDVNRCAALLTDEQLEALEQPPAKR